MIDPHEKIDSQALDYVTGFAGKRQRRRTARSLSENGALADAVYDWETRLRPLLATVGPEAPPEALWERIESRIDGSRSRGPGRGIEWIAGAGLTVAALGLFLFLRPAATSQDRVSLASADGAILATGIIERHARLTLDATAMPPAPTGKDYELWLIPAAGGAPRPEGVMPKGPAIAMTLPDAEQGATLAVSVEPAGGSPTGAPTGPVVASGKIAHS